MNDFNQFKITMKEIVDNWKKNIKPGIEEQGKYGETNTRKYLIDPVLNALNWVDDGSKKIIDNEFSIKHKTGIGNADYALKIDNVPKILIEAKDVIIKDLINGYDTLHGIKRTYPRQLSNYCHDLNSHEFQIKFAILTNGKEWVLYNMQYADISSEREVIFHLDIEELDQEDNLKKLWALEYNDFTKEQFGLKELVQRLNDYRMAIDKRAVQNLLECKDLLSESIFNDYEKNKLGIKQQIDMILEDKKKISGMPTFKDFPDEERLNFFIKEASSSLINKILFIRILEDKNFLTPKLTKRKIEEWKDFFGYNDYNEIMNLFREACRITENQYNGGLFKLNPYDEITYDPTIIKKIIDILGDINFREIDADIIGRIYEIYLGQVLKVESEIHGKKRTKYQTDNMERKKLGQYYTPKFIVDFIVKNTLKKMIEGKTPEEIDKIRILDPACGSGSFLINAYDVLSEYYDNWNITMLKKITEEAKTKGASIGAYTKSGMIPNYKNIILKENIHGVDLNDLSVQICEINLWLRALERNKKLIKLNKNILNGNSLVSGVENKKEIDEYNKEIEDIKKRTIEIKNYYDKDDFTNDEENKLKLLETQLRMLKDEVNNKINKNLKEYYEDNITTVHPFNWEIEFPQNMKENGFDIIIGNPPYGAEFNQYDRNYFKNKNPDFIGMDSASLFIKKSIELLKHDGYLGFIVPKSITYVKNWEGIREYLLKTTEIKYIIDVSKAFEEVLLEQIIIIVQKRKAPEKYKVKVGYAHQDNVLTSFAIKDVDIENFTPKKFGIYMDESNSKIYDRMNKGSVKLSQIADVFNGCNLNKFIKKDNEKDHTICLRGKDIQKYYKRTYGYVDKKYIDFNIEKYQTKKIIAQDIVAHILKPNPHIKITATIDYENQLNLNTITNIILSSTDYELEYILGILNSNLISWYAYLFVFNQAVRTMHLRKGYVDKIPIKEIEKKEQKNISGRVETLIRLLDNKNSIYNYLNNSFSNQPINDKKICNFGRYFDAYESYDIKRETFNGINKINAKLMSVNAKEDGKSFSLYINYDDNNGLKENVKAITMTIENDDIRNFLLVAIEKYTNGKRGTLGNGNLLELLKKIEIPTYAINVKINIEKIKEVMKEFNHNTKDLWWKDISKKDKFSSLTEINEEIQRIDNEINEIVYDLYDIKSDEKKMIEENLDQSLINR
ncbi:MAG: N-6 DNA methylase [Nanoarchaeota archaeon]|nr:N-6 DNA methylase [Nanoarchaeota archaeon]